MFKENRATKPEAIESAASTISGNRGLMIEEKLIFELDDPGRIGVDLPKPVTPTKKLGKLAPRAKIGLPSLSEPEVVRHYTRLSQKNYGIDTGFFPLGSCSMKHNPRLNEKMARLPGFGDIHPLQPQSTVQGAFELIDMLAHWLKTLTGMPAVAMSPAAGAHGEACGMMAIRAALEAKGEKRNRVLVPEAAHGTNPATAAACGFTVDSFPQTNDGRVDMMAFKAKLGPDVAAIMLTNPNTCGLFERDIIEIAKLIHDAGGYFYCDGANYNALIGRVKPGDLGIDCMHINLHKTCSTPHGGGGPGSGPVVFSKALAPYAPLPWIIHEGNNFNALEVKEGPAQNAFGRIKAFHGQMGMFVRAMAYCLSHGSDGLRQVAEDAVLNANYLLASLKDVLEAPYPGPCMHEAVFSDKTLTPHGISTMDLAKALIDEGYHPMTMYFPLVVQGAILIEPTETESKATLDQFINSVRGLIERLKKDGPAYFKGAPYHTPRRRLDETQAARQPVLRWKKPA
ncbi:MAG: aminomethyl-transferring glycine dehydrogenase subunit GcvPB [Dongiaceae bacterium]